MLTSTEHMPGLPAEQRASPSGPRAPAAGRTRTNTLAQVEQHAPAHDAVAAKPATAARSTARNRSGIAGVLGRWALGFLLLLPLLGGAMTGVTVCPLAGLLGIPCPGCGLGRATLAALKGHFREAFYYHPLFFVVSPLYLFLLGALLLDLVAPGRHRSLRLPERWVFLGGAGLVGLLVAVWTARMLGAFGGPVPVHPWVHWWH